MSENHVYGKSLPKNESCLLVHKKDRQDLFIFLTVTRLLKAGPDATLFELSSVS